MGDEFNKTDIRKPRNEDFDDDERRNFNRDRKKAYGTFVDGDDRLEEPTDEDGNVKKLIIYKIKLVYLFNTCDY